MALILSFSVNICNKSPLIDDCLRQCIHAVIVIGTDSYARLIVIYHFQNNYNYRETKLDDRPYDTDLTHKSHTYIQVVPAVVFCILIQIFLTLFKWFPTVKNCSVPLLYFTFLIINYGSLERVKLKIIIIAKKHQSKASFHTYISCTIKKQILFYTVLNC